MATISSPGLGSGLDVKSIVTQLVALERKPVTLLQSKGSAMQSKLSVWGQIKSNLATLDDAGTALLNPDTWNGRTFTSADTSAITGSASSSALSSTFSVQVNALAKVQATASAGLTTGSAVGADGRLDIQLGTWSGNSFAAGAGAVASVSVLATDTLSDVATKINAANAGVSAIVVNTGGQDKLLVRGAQTGAANGFQIKAYDSGGAPITDGLTGVGFLAHDYDSVAGTFYGMGRNQSAQDASASIDGVTVTSSTNTIGAAISGVTLDLKTTTTSAVQVTVAQDTELIKTKLESFRTAYNTVRTQLSQSMAYDPAAKSGGPLLGDNTAMGLESMLRDLATASGPTGNALSRLSDMGLEMQRDGTLVTNTTKLDAALTDTTNLRDFLTASSGTAATDGIARRLRDFVRTANGIDGNVSGRQSAIQANIDRNAKTIESMNARIALTETRLYAQYARLDANLGTLNGLGSFITQQVAQWNKTG